METESASISQFFKILGSVEQQKGCCRLGTDADGRPQQKGCCRLGTDADGRPVCEYTIYSSCCNLDRGIYYYTTYENSQIAAVDMHHTDLDAEQLTSFELVQGQQIRMQN